MNREKIRKLIDDLDREVTREGALLRIHKQTKPYGNVMLGNEKGLLRFGIHSLRNAIELPSKNHEEVDSFKSQDLDYLQGDELEEFQFLRNDQVKKLTLEESQEQTRLAFDKPTRAFIYWFIAVFCVFILIGVYTTISWIFDWFGWNY